MRCTVLILICWSLLNLNCTNDKGYHDNNGSSVKYAPGIKVTSIDSLTKDQRYDSLYVSIECEESEYEEKKKSIEMQIDALLDTLQIQLKRCNKDSTRVNPLIELLAKERYSYKSDIGKSAELVFWSYGVASMTGERVVAEKCYYLRELNNRYYFYLAICEKIKGTLLNM